MTHLAKALVLLGQQDPQAYNALVQILGQAKDMAVGLGMQSIAADIQTAYINAQNSISKMQRQK